MLKVQERAKPETATWLTQEEIFFANNGQHDLQFHTNTKELCKAKVQLVDEKVYLADLSFNYPITLNEKAIAPGSKISIQHGDRFTLGNTTFEIIDTKLLLSGFSDENKASHTSPPPLTKAESNKDAQTHYTEKQWITKPTSIGNRPDDSLDRILAEHQKKRRLLNTSFALIGLLVITLLIYWLT